ncbi:MAG: hypothetical protein L6371_03065 [Candidatus Atribacteria bacterium]|nr:hypothetical protein [Candidatus Atribacteria bacterium]
MQTNKQKAKLSRGLQEMRVFKTSGKDKLLHLQRTRKKGLLQIMADKRSGLATSLNSG